MHGRQLPQRISFGHVFDSTRLAYKNAKLRILADKLSVQIFATALAGLQSAEHSLDQTAGHLARVAANSGGSPQDSADLPTDMVNLVVARQEHAANCQSIKVADEMWQHTVDLIA